MQHKGINVYILPGIVWIVLSLSNTGRAQDILETTVSGVYYQSTLAAILNDFEFNQSIRFFYKKEWLDMGLIDISFNHTPLRNALDDLLRKRGLSYAVLDQKAIVIAKAKDLEETYAVDFFARQNELERAAALTNIRAIGEAASANKTGKAFLNGQITDAISGVPVIGAGVFTETNALATATDTGGRYELELPIGIHQLNISAPGYELLNVPFRIFQNGQLDAALFVGSVRLKEIVVTDAANKKIRSSKAGLTELSAKEVKQTPAFAGEADVIKSLLTLPGVSTVGEGAGGYNVRGGNTDQNLTLQDGATVFNTSHALGLFSTFNADVVQKLSLYKGYIPAQYGGRVSSILDVQLAEGNQEKWGASGGIGLFASRLRIDGPIQKNKTSLLIAGRITYSDWALHQASKVELKNSSAFFYDFNGKLTYVFDDHTKLTLSAYSAYDKFLYNNVTGYNYGEQIYGLSFNKTWGVHWNSLFTANYGDTRNGTYNADSTAVSRLNTGLENITLRERLLITQIKKHIIHTGVEWTRHRQHPEIYQQDATTVQTAEQTQVEKSSGQELSFFVNDEMEIAPWLGISAGLRQTFYRQTGPATVYCYAPNQSPMVNSIVDTAVYASGSVVKSYNGLEPRLAFNFILNKATSVKLSYNRLYQYIHLLSNTAASAPADVWQVSTLYIPPQRSDNYSLGVYRNFNNNEYETSIEGYYRNIDHVAEYKDFANLLLNPHIETEIAPARAKTYGVETYLRKSYGEITGSVSYTYARSLRQTIGLYPDQTINKGAWFPANFDKPHQANINFNWQIRKVFSFAAYFTYSTGRPITVPIGDYPLGTGGVFYNYGDRNTYRIPDYHRLDLSFTLSRGEIRTSRYQSSWTFSVYNVYGRKNPFSFYFTQTRDEPLRGYQLSVLGSPVPAITYNFHY